MALGQLLDRGWPYANHFPLMDNSGAAPAGPRPVASLPGSPRLATGLGSGLPLLAQKLNQYSTYLLGLLLLHPVARSIDQMKTASLRHDNVAHFFHVTGFLIGAPVAFSGDKTSRHIDRATGKNL